jgi:uncharacterized protein with GYD domain
MPLGPRSFRTPRIAFRPVRAPIESLGGTVHSAFFAVDSFDVLVLAEFPENVSAADIDIQFFSGGEVAAIHTTRLLDATHVLEAMCKVGPSYQPIPRARALAVDAS